MLPLTKEELKPHQDVKVYYIFGKIILKRLSKIINYQKVRDHYHDIGTFRDAAHSLYNLKFNMPNEIPAVFHNDSNYDYHFFTK